MKNIFKLLIIAMWILSLPVHADTIESLVFEGAPLDWNERLKQVSGLQPGDSPNEEALQSAREKVLIELDERGYPNADVQLKWEPTSTESLRLIWKVTLGNPINIKKILFEGENISAGFLAQLAPYAVVKPDEVLDRERIRELKRNIEILMLNENYIDSKVEKIRSEAEGDGVRLIFELNLGQRVEFSFIRNQKILKAELMRLVADQINVGLGRDFIGVIQRRVENYYRELGFKNVQLVPYVYESKGREPKKVVYEVFEGERIRIRRFVFEGSLSFTQSELETLLYEVAPDRIVARIYNSVLLDSAMQSLIERIRQRGFLSAKILALKVIPDPSGQYVDVRVFLNEGLQTRVQQIEFKGNQEFQSAFLEGLLGIRPGDSLNLLRFEEGLDAIKKAYRDRGYLKLEFTNEVNNGMIRYTEKSQNAYILIDLNEGPQYRFAGFRVFGNEKTILEVLEREFRLLPGDVLDESKVLATEQRLRRLGVFNSIQLELKDELNLQGEPYQNAKVTVTESTPGNAGFGIGFRNDLGIRVFTDVVYNNLWGLNHSWVLNASGNRRITAYQFTEYGANLSYIWPWFTLGDTTFRPGFLAERRQYRQFSGESFAFSASLERRLYAPLGISGALTYSLEQIRQFLAVGENNNGQARIGSITPLIRLDQRDNPLAPRSGFFGLMSFEFATPILGSQQTPVPISYSRFQFRTDQYWNPFSKLLLYTSVRGGWAKNHVNSIRSDGSVDSRVTIPLIKQFALGGVNSIRGFIDQEITAQVSDPNRKIQGYMTFVNYRTQFDYLASKNLAFGPFLDAGNLMVDSFTFGNLRYGSGLGMRYLTPVGPVNFDWGFKLFPKPGEETNVFYFSIGII